MYFTILVVYNCWGKCDDYRFCSIYNCFYLVITEAEAEALQEAVPEIGEGAEKSPQGSGGVLTQRKKRTADEVNTPCRPTREGKR